MDIELRVSEDGEMIENSSIRELNPSEGDVNSEPCEGMEFESEEAANVFYDAYASRLGFKVRVSICRRSKRDGAIISRRFVCNKEGFRMKEDTNKIRIKRPRAITREGCKAMMMVKRQESGKWIVTRFIKEHNHALVISSAWVRRGSLQPLSLDEKDRRIQELTIELKRSNRRCAAYRDRLQRVLKNIEEHKQELTKKVEAMEYTINEIDHR